LYRSSLKTKEKEREKSTESLASIVFQKHCLEKQRPLVQTLFFQKLDEEKLALFRFL
jgi:hypothetical protein